MTGLPVSSIAPLLPISPSPTVHLTSDHLLSLVEDQLQRATAVW